MSKTKNILTVSVIVISLLGVFFASWFHYDNVINIIFRLLGLPLLIGGLVLIQRAFRGYGASGRIVTMYSRGRLVKPKKATTLDRLILWTGSVFAIVLGIELILGWQPTYLQAILLK